MSLLNHLSCWQAHSGYILLSFEEAGIETAASFIFHRILDILLQLKAWDKTDLSQETDHNNIYWEERFTFMRPKVIKRIPFLKTSKKNNFLQEWNYNTMLTHGNAATTENLHGVMLDRRKTPALRSFRKPTTIHILLTHLHTQSRGTSPICLMVVGLNYSSVNMKQATQIESHTRWHHVCLSA